MGDPTSACALLRLIVTLRNSTDRVFDPINFASYDEVLHAPSLAAVQPPSAIRGCKAEILGVPSAELCALARPAAAHAVGAGHSRNSSSGATTFSGVSTCAKCELSSSHTILASGSSACRRSPTIGGTRG